MANKKFVCFSGFFFTFFTVGLTIIAIQYVIPYIWPKHDSVPIRSETPEEKNLISIDVALENIRKQCLSATKEEILGYIDLKHQNPNLEVQIELNNYQNCIVVLASQYEYDELQSMNMIKGIRIKCDKVKCTSSYGVSDTSMVFKNFYEFFQKISTQPSFYGNGVYDALQKLDPLLQKSKGFKCINPKGTCNNEDESLFINPEFMTLQIPNQLTLDTSISKFLKREEFYGVELSADYLELVNFHCKFLSEEKLYDSNGRLLSCPNRENSAIMLGEGKISAQLASTMVKFPAIAEVVCKSQKRALLKSEVDALKEPITSRICIFVQDGKIVEQSTLNFDPNLPIHFISTDLGTEQNPLPSNEMPLDYLSNTVILHSAVDLSPLWSKISNVWILKSDYEKIEKGDVSQIEDKKVQIYMQSNKMKAFIWKRRVIRFKKSAWEIIDKSDLQNLEHNGFILAYKKTTFEQILIQNINFEPENLSDVEKLMKTEFGKILVLKYIPINVGKIHDFYLGEDKLKSCESFVNSRDPSKTCEKVDDEIRIKIK